MALCGLEQLVASTVREAAEQLELRATAEGLDWINERDHLQPAFTEALRVKAAGWPGEPVVNEHRALALPEDFESKGGIDNSICWSEELPVFIELKAGSDRSSLDACAWDLVKLAAALRAKKCGAAFLVAAAPLSRWEDSKTAGVELFAGGKHAVETLRERYASGWQRWERDGYRPLQAPTAISTEHEFAATARFTTTADGNAALWEVRTARVVVSTDATWLRWTTP